MDVQIHNISVEKLAESKYQVTLEPHNCAFDFPLLRVSGAQVTWEKMVEYLVNYICIKYSLHMLIMSS